MSLKDLERHLKKGGTKAMLVLALEASALNASAQSQQKATPVEEKQKTEYTAKKINLFDVAEVEHIVQDGELYFGLGDRAFEEEQTDRKKILKEWKESEKEAYANAEPDRVDTLSLKEAGEFGHFNPGSKNVVMNYVQMDAPEKLMESYIKKNPGANHTAKAEFMATIASISEMNNPQSLVHQSCKAHEKQHATNDKLGIFAPGLSPEQYAVLSQYDEVGANVAELNVYISGYKKKLANGASREEALKAFDRNPDGCFNFYREALAKGLDPDSKEGRQLMVTGTHEMWKNQRRAYSGYQEQIKGVGAQMVGRSDLASTIVGNEEELQKRIDKIFDNIGKNDYCKENSIDSPGNLSKYLPEQRMELLPNVRQSIERETEEYTGISTEQREAIKQSLDGKSDKKKVKNLLKVVTGRKSPEQVAAQKSGLGRQPVQNNAAVKKTIAEEMAKSR